MKNSLQGFRLAKSLFVATLVGATFTFGANYANADDSAQVTKGKTIVAENKTPTKPDPTPDPVGEPVVAYSDKDGDIIILTKNGGVYTINEDLNALSLTLNGDGTGAVKVNGDLNLSEFLEVKDTLIDVVDNDTKDYVLPETYSAGGGLAIDVNLNKMESDKFIINGDSSGILYLDTINFIGSADEFTIQILDLNGEKNGLQLGFSKNINIIGLPEVDLLTENFDIMSAIADTVTFGDIYGGERGLTLTTTKTINDSISVDRNLIYDDILTYINQKNTLSYEEDEDNGNNGGFVIGFGNGISINDRIPKERTPILGERSFNFKTAKDVYKVGTMLSNDRDYQGIGVTASGKLSINGVSDSQGNYSTIDFNGYNGFILAEYNILTLNNVTIKNAVANASEIIVGNVVRRLPGSGGAIYNSGLASINHVNSVSINNAVFQNNSAKESGGAIYNIGSLDINNVIFRDNTARESGGAIYNSSAFIRDVGYSMYTNQTDYEEISNANFGIMSINNSTFSGNGVLSNNDALGGAIYTRGYKNAVQQNQSVQNYIDDFNSNSWYSHNGPNSAYVIIYGAAEEPETVVSTDIVNTSFTGNYAIVKNTTNNGTSNSATNTATSGSNGNSGKETSNMAHQTVDNRADTIQIEGQDDNVAIIGSGAKDARVGDGKTHETGGIPSASDKPTPVAHGGAIYMVNDLNLVAKDGYKSVISGNYVVDSDGKRDEAIYVTSSTNKIKEEVGVVSRRYIPPYAMETTQRYVLDRVYKDKPNLNGATLNIEAKTGGQFVINDKIVGEERGAVDIADKNYYSYTYNLKPNAESFNPNNYATRTVYLDDDGNEVADDDVTHNIVELPRHKLNFIGDSTGKVTLNNNVENLDVSVSDITLHLGHRDNVLDGNNLVLNSGTLNMVNNQVGISALQSLTLNGDTNFIADVDLAKSSMDRFTAESYGEHKGNLNVVGMNILSDATKATTDIYFAEPGLKDNVVSSVGDLPDSNQTTAYSPIYKYNVRYENRPDAGYFVFDKGSVIRTPEGGISNSGNASDNFNPAVLVSSVATQAAAQTTMNQTFNYVFEHADTFMTMPNIERMAKINSNSVALSTDFNENLGRIDVDHANKGVWVRPYTAFENMPLKHGPKVDIISYGTFVGFDSEIHKLKHGWANVGTAYLGYNGIQMKYNGVDTSTNGGLLGLTETFYKGNFFTALTATAGAGVADSNTMYGHEDNVFLMGGIGSKTGYNFEFKGGKYIVQPIMFMSYSIVKGLDYTNAAGVRIDSDASHTVQLNPNVRFIGNFNGWQPYASVGMVWDVLHESNARANGVKLPEMYTKPYVQYGVGLQRCWDDRYSAFGQAMLRNGGRNGISLTFGFRWALDNNPNLVNRNIKGLKQSTSKPDQTRVKKVIKQMS